MSRLKKCSIGQQRAAIITTRDGGTHCRSALGRIRAAVRLKSVRWCTGFRISCVGASRDQMVVVLSMERGPGREDVTQETLRTSDFPVKASTTPSQDRAPNCHDQCCACQRHGLENAQQKEASNMSLAVVIAHLY